MANLNRKERRATRRIEYYRHAIAPIPLDSALPARL